MNESRIVQIYSVFYQKGNPASNKTNFIISDKEHAYDMIKRHHTHPKHIKLRLININCERLLEDEYE